MTLMSNGKEMKHLDKSHCDECGGFVWFLIPIVYQGNDHKICRQCMKRRLGL